MIDRRTALAFFAVAATAGVVRADDAMPAFTQDAFDQAIESGQPMLIHVSTTWCPICKAQKPILAKFRSDPRFRDMLWFNIDFDHDKPSARKLGAQHQTTLILFKAGKEIGRSVGESQPEWIEDLLERAL